MAERAAQRFTMSRADCPLVQAEGWDASLAAFEAALSEALGVGLPASAGEVVRSRGVRVVRIGPRRFWLLYDAAGASPLRIDADLGCLLDLGEGRVAIRLSGAGAAEILAGCIAVDWHSPAAAPGRAVQTSFHRIPVLFVRVAEAACELVVPRSFAASLVDWIGDRAPDRDR